MSATEVKPPEQTTPCANCESPLQEDQEWCLECGASRTLIHSPPDWRIGVGIVLTVVTLALVALAIVLVNLSSSSSQTVTTVTAATATVPTPTASTPSPQTFSGWPVGLSGWTVVLATSRTEAGADAAATQLAGSGVRVGVLDSDQHPSLPPGQWLVFSGRYPNGVQARAAAARLRSEGQATATARLIARPGGL